MQKHFFKKIGRNNLDYRIFLTFGIACLRKMHYVYDDRRGRTVCMEVLFVHETVMILAERHAEATFDYTYKY